MRRHALVGAGIALTMLAGCTGGSGARDATAAASASSTPTATADDPDATPSPTASPAATPAATATPTPTASPTLSLRVLVTTDNLNVRLGPDRGYAVRGQLNTGDEVTAIARSEDSEWLALDGLGWVFFDEGWVEVNGDIAALPDSWEASYAVVGPGYEPGFRTGLAHVDVLVDAVEVDDLEAVASMLRVYSDVCPRDGPNLPPSCPANEGGAPFDVVLTANGCEGAYVPASDRLAVVEAWHLDARYGEPLRVAQQPPHLYAVTDYEDGIRGVVFAFESGVGAFARVHPDGSIDLIANACEHWPANLMLHTSPSRPAPTMLLPPTKPAPLD